MTYVDSHDCLKYRLIGSAELITSWGHEYVRYTIIIIIAFILNLPVIQGQEERYTNEAIGGCG